MPQVQIYLTEDEYYEYLKEAEQKSTRVSILLAEKLREARKWTK